MPPPSRRSCATPPQDDGFAVDLWKRFVLPRGCLLAAWWAMNSWLTLPVWLAYGVIGADVLVLSWQIRRFHRSADAHVRDSGAMMATWGGYLLVLLAVFASVTQWWGASLRANAPPKEESIFTREQRARDALYSLVAAPDGQSLLFEGEIAFGVKARIEAHLAQAPQIRRIVLQSPGGHVFEARGAAQVILRHGLDTHVRSECSSACTLMFMAGAQRSLAEAARLGFHGYALGATHLPGYDIDAQEQKDLSFFRYRGVEPIFAARLFDAAPTQMWYPSPAELRALGVVTRITD